MLKILKHYTDKNNDILLWKFWGKLKSKSFGSFQLWTSLFFVIIFYLPFLGQSAKNWGFLFFGDNISLWIPQLFNTYQFNNDFVFKGIDFFTHGGASEYFLRPNILTYNPIFLFLSYIVDIDGINDLLGLSLLLFILHSFVACFFTQILCIKFFNFDRYLSLFVGVSFASSLFLINNLGFIPFFFITCLSPICLYGILSYHRNGNILNLLTSSFIVLTLYTSGYLMLSIFSIVIIVIFCVFYLYTNNKFKIKDLGLIFAPLFLSSIISLPLYLAIFDFHKIVVPDVLTLDAAAHALGTNPNISLRLFSNSIQFPLGEQQSIAIGIIPLLIAIIFIFSFNENIKKLLEKNAKLAVFCFAIFVLVLLSCFGIYSPFSYFMYIIPAIGKTHLYTRYLMPLSLFLFIGLGILLDIIVTERNSVVCKGILAVLLMLFIFTTTMAYQGSDIKGFADGYFIFELILAMIVTLVFLLLKNRAVTIMLVTITTFCVSLGWFYKLSFSSLENSNKEMFYEQVYKSNENTDKLINYFKGNSKSEIIKVVHVTPEFATGGYFLKNVPWLLRKKIKISSYYGYEIHLARDISYAQKVIPYEVRGNNPVFLPNINWLKETGAEFVIFKKDFIYNDEELLKYVDMTKHYEFPQNTIIAPLNFQKPENTIFNNGYIRALSLDSSAGIDDFKTNDANRISFKTRSDEPLVIQYLFWPNKHLKPYIDSKLSQFEKVGNLDTLKIPAGNHKVRIFYENLILDIFFVLYFGFIATLILSILWKAFMVVRKK